MRKERGEQEGRKEGGGGARVINTICCVAWNKTPCRKIRRRRKGGETGGSGSVSYSQTTLWPLDDTSHRQSAA